VRPEVQDQRLPLKQLALLVRDLQRPRPVIYWADLICCVLVTDIGLILSGPFPNGITGNPVIGVAGFVVAVFALYRASYFNHEIAHQSRRLPGFAFVWNLLVGIPLLVPSFLYSDHRNHHSVRSFANRTDAEYFPPELRGARGGLALLVASFLLPFVYAVRFAVLAPAAWLSAPVRHWVDTRASSLGLLGLSPREPPAENERWTWRVQEAACFCYLLGGAAGLASGLIPFELVVRFYAVTVCVLALHGIRIMAGHRYEADANARTLVDQLRDSFNFTGNRPVTWLMVPLGFDLHALHHLFPTLPYHNLQAAHRRITAALPPGSIYHSVESPSFFAVVMAFLGRGQVNAGHPAGTGAP
jgi:fatty acid desaturase